MPAFIDLTGRKFGRWTVLRRGEDTAYRHPRWVVRCECGGEGLVKGQTLRTGDSRSCGCYNLEVRRQICLDRNTTHGQASRKAKSLTYVRWLAMRDRCDRPYATAYPKYGAKGIRVCERWQAFENFRADMGECPSVKHGIDRIDPKGHYEPANCRWATQKEQQNNRSNNRRLTLDGVTLTLAQWSEKVGLHRDTITRRIDRLGWSVELALNVPPR